VIVNNSTNIQPCSQVTLYMLGAVYNLYLQSTYQSFKVIIGRRVSGTPVKI